MNILKVLTEKRKVGNIGERAAAKYLKKSGYKILKMNYSPLDREIDIIAENREVCAFVEVKTRTLGTENENEARPAAAVTPQKQRGIISAAKYFLGSYSGNRRARLDIIEVYLDKRKKVQKILHLEGAFNLNTAHER